MKKQNAYIDIRMYTPLKNACIVFRTNALTLQCSVTRYCGKARRMLCLAFSPTPKNITKALIQNVTKKTLEI